MTQPAPLSKTEFEARVRAAGLDLTPDRVLELLRVFPLIERLSARLREMAGASDPAP